MRVLDYQKVKMKEKKEAKLLFEGKSMEILKKDLVLAKETEALKIENEEEKKLKGIRVKILEL